MSRLVPRSEVVDQPGYGWAEERWLRRQNAERRLAYVKIAGKVLIDLDDLDALADRGRVEAVGPALFRAVRSSSRKRAS
jgi:hypothetical protein